MENLINKLDFCIYVVNLCLFYCTNLKGFVTFCIYMNDCYIMDNKRPVKTVIEEIKKLYTSHKIYFLKEYLGVTINCYNNHTFLSSQPDTIKK